MNEGSVVDATKHTVLKYDKNKLVMSFNVTPSRDMSVNKLKEIYCSLIYCLKLSSNTNGENNNTNGGRSLISFTSRIYKKKSIGYCFTVEQALECMKTLSIKMQRKTTVTVINYQIKDHLAKDLLQVFVNAKLLHFPHDRTRNLVKNEYLLQPTPKGVAMLECFCTKNEITGNMLPPILFSSLSSMQLILFERREKSNALIFSEYWIKYLFVLMMGTKPNVWSPHNEPEGFQKTSTHSPTNISSSTFTFETFPHMQNQENFLEYLHQKRQSVSAPYDFSSNSDSTPELSNGNKNRKFENDIVSPIYHKYFTNPESDAHVQYYVSGSGVRAIKNKSILISKTQTLVVDYCYSGKAIVQWLMDCSDLIYFEESFETANLFVLANLLELINACDFPKYQTKRCFIPDGRAWYKVTPIGLKLVQWKKSEVVDVGHGGLSTQSDLKFSDSRVLSSPNPISRRRRQERVRRKLTLQHILQDPALKYLFRANLNEEFCAENLDIYEELTSLNKRFDSLRRLLELRENDKERQTKSISDSPRTEIRKPALSEAIVELSNECLSKVYNIYNTYLANDVPNEVNINHSLKTQIIDLMSSNTSPIQRTFSSLPSTLPDPQTTENLDSLLRLKHLTISEDETECDSKSNIAKRLDGDKGISVPSVSILNSPTKMSGPIMSPDSQTRYMLQVSPTDDLVTPSIRLIHQVAPFYQEVQNQIAKMMEADSLPKFLNSSRFDEISNLLVD